MDLPIDARLISASPATHRPAPLHVGKILPPPYAGIEAHIDTLLRSLNGLADSTLVASRSWRAPPRPDIAGHPYRVLTVKSLGIVASVAMSPAMLNTIRTELSNGNANLLHIHAPNPWGDIAALTCGANTPVVMSWHSDIVRQKLLMKLYSGVQGRSIDRADQIIVFTPKHLESSLQLKRPGVEKKVRLIPMGIDFSRIDSTPPDRELLHTIDTWSSARKVVLTVGRHIYYKGYEYLLEAFSKLRSDPVLIMVGKGPLTDDLKAQAEQLGISKRVLFLGETSNSALVTLLHRCDIFTLPSVEPSEAFGIATAEAMACSKPAVVCFLDNGVNYLTKDGITGIATTPRDTGELAAAIDSLALDDALRKRMGAEAYKWVRSEFSLDRMRDETLSVYRGLT